MLRQFFLLIVSLSILTNTVLIRAMSPHVPGSNHESMAKAALEKMTYQELKTNKDLAIQKGKKETAIKYLKEMIRRTEDLNEAQEMLFTLAQFYFEIEEFGDAQEKFLEYCTLYPGGVHLEQASYMAIRACFAQTRPCDRDQQKTNETVNLIKDYHAKEKKFSTYVTQINEIEQTCYQKLLESELNIYHFYLKGGKLNSAQHHLKLIEEEFGPKIIPHQLYELKVELAQAQKNDELILALHTEYLTKFHESPPSMNLTVASKQNNKKSVDIF